MALLTVKDLYKTYGEKAILRGASLVIGPGERIGMVGANGSGKSSLLRILAGEEEPDAGERTTRRGLRLAYLEQDPDLDPDDTVRQAVRRGLSRHNQVRAALDRVHEDLADPDLSPEDMERLLERQSALDEELEALGGHEVEHRIESMIQDLGLPDPDAPVAPMSGGERRRIAIARHLLSGPDLLLLDEPTNHLDAEVIDWLENHLISWSAGLVLVTHDRYFLDRVVTRIVEVEAGQLHEYEGGYHEFLEGRAARLARAQQAESTRLNLLRRETEWMRRGPPARTTKSKARIQSYQALVDAAPERSADELSFRIPYRRRLGDRVLRFEGVSKGFGGRDLFTGLDLELGPGERLGIVGPNGAGKSTLIQLAMGRLEPDAGTVHVGSTVEWAQIDQARSGLDPTRTVRDEVGDGEDWVFIDGNPLRIESFLERFLFPGKVQRTLVGDLSGGELGRVHLAKLLARSGNLLVLDEPTNDLDLMTLRVLEEALIDFPGSALIVSHDRWFLDRVATRVLFLDGDGGHRLHAGALSLLLDKLAVEREQARTAAAAAAARERQKEKARASAAAAAADASAPRKLSSKERRELEELPDRIAGAEEELEQLDAELADPQLYRDGEGGEKVRSLQERRAAAAAAVQDLYGRWEELEALG